MVITRPGFLRRRAAAGPLGGNENNHTQSVAPSSHHDDNDSETSIAMDEDDNVSLLSCIVVAAASRSAAAIDDDDDSVLSDLPSDYHDSVSGDSDNESELTDLPDDYQNSESGDNDDNDSDHSEYDPEEDKEDEVDDGDDNNALDIDGAAAGKNDNATPVDDNNTNAQQTQGFEELCKEIGQYIRDLNNNPFLNYYEVGHNRDPIANEFRELMAMLAHTATPAQGALLRAYFATGCTATFQEVRNVLTFNDQDCEYFMADNLPDAFAEYMSQL